MKKITTVQTAFGNLYETVEKEIRDELNEEIEFSHIIDSSLIFDVMKSGGLNEKISQRVCCLLEAACCTGADLVICTCSSIGEAVDAFTDKNPQYNVMRIDYPMAKYVVEHDIKKVVVLATLSTTVEPSVSLIEKEAEKKGKKIEVISASIDGAFEAMISGEIEKAVSLIREKAEETCTDVDIIVLAQASMARFIPVLREIVGDEKVILDSPSTCASYLKKNAQVFQSKEI